jgi:NAD(P)H-hydrate epimerase
VGTRQEHLAAVLAGRPECMVVPVEANADLEEPLQRATVAALGPGLGQGDWGRARFEHLRGWSGPMVMDADALNLLAADPDRHEQRVITPHPGEAARLLGWDTATVQADRFAAVEALQARYGGVVVLKGAGTLITDGTHTWLSDTGNPGMASGGMGDVLTGVIAGLLAQGLPTARAAALGVWCHGRAADQASKAGGERGLLAGDLVSRLPAVVNP